MGKGIGRRFEGKRKKKKERREKREERREKKIVNDWVDVYH